MTHQAPADVVVSSNEDPLSVLLHQVGVVCGYHITRPATEDHEFVNVCNGDLRTLHEAYDALAPLNATTPDTPALAPDRTVMTALDRLRNPDHVVPLQTARLVDQVDLDWLLGEYTGARVINRLRDALSDPSARGLISPQTVTAIQDVRGWLDFALLDALEAEK